MSSHFEAGSPVVPSAEELTWLKATILIGEAPRGQDPFATTSTGAPSLNDFYLKPPPIHRRPATPPFPPTAPPTGTQSLPCTPPKSQWIYRRPKPPASPRSRSANPSPYSSPNPYSKSSPRPAYAHATPFLTRSISSASSQSAVSTLSKLDHSVPPSDVLWSSPIRPRQRPERVPPVLKTIPSQSQIDLTPTDLTVMDFSRPTPKKIIRQPSFASTTSSCSISGSTSQSSSRSESPVTPGSVSCSPYSTSKPRRPNHRRYTSEPDKSDPGFVQLSSSCPPSKSILTRSPSIRTNGSSQTINKSVKFAAAPVVHYGWDFEVHAEVEEDQCMGISVDDMDIDVDDSFEEYRAHLRRGEVKILDLSKFREYHGATPTPERERSKSRLSGVSVGGGKGLKRLMGSVTRKPTPTTRMETDSAKPVISLPYALGTVPPPNSSSVSSQAMRSTTSLRSTQSKFRKAQGSVAPVESSLASSVGVGNTTGGLAPSSHSPSPGHANLRNAPSIESFRSSKSAAARSVRSVGSVKSSMSTRGFRAWLSRAMGWSE